MKKIKNIIYPGVISAAIALLIISLKETRSITIPAEEVHQAIVREEHFILPSDIDRMIPGKPYEFVFVDLRSPEAFEIDHPKSTVNIPFQRVLDEKFASLLHGKRTKILYASSVAKAAETWVILKQAGVDNVFVLKGGLPYWQERIEGRNAFGKVIFDDERPRYDFKMELSENN